MIVAQPQETRIQERLRTLAGDARTEQAIAWIAQRHRLTDATISLQNAATSGEITQAFLNSQVFLLAASVGEVLMGRLHPNFLIRALAERLQLSMDEARAIGHDVSREIFAHVKQELVDLYHMRAVPKVHLPPEVRESAEEAFAATEAPDAFQTQEGAQTPEVEEVSEAPPAQGLAAQVVEGAFPRASPNNNGAAPPEVPSQEPEFSVPAPESAGSPETSTVPKTQEVGGMKEAPPATQDSWSGPPVSRASEGGASPNIVDLRTLDENSFAPPPPSLPEEGKP